MSFRTRKIPTLQDKCIDNIARNIVMHGDVFEKYGTDEVIRIRYQLLQRFFTNELVQKCFEICSEAAVCFDRKFEEFINLCFAEESVKGIEEWPCINFLFNEQTAVTFTPRHEYERDTRIIPKEIVSYISFHCKNLRDIHLGLIYSAEVLQGIFERCPLIRKISADLSKGDGVSDAFLLCLCKHRSHRDEFVFCPENGACSSTGKRLQSLRILLANTNGAGIACALQHLPQLEDFYELPFNNRRFIGDRRAPDVTRGILILQNAAAYNGRTPVTLRITEIFFDKLLNRDEICTVLSCCPRLESVQLNLGLFNPQIFSSPQNIKRLHLPRPEIGRLNFMEFRPFLSIQGNKIEALSFLLCDAVSDFTDISRIIGMCQSLKQLTFTYLLTPYRAHNIVDVDYLKADSLGRVEKLVLKLPRLYPPNNCSFYKYLHHVLCEARNLKSLDVPYPLAEEGLASAININDFRNLTDICIRYADVDKVPLEKLVETTALRKIQFHDCYYSDSVIKRFKDFAKKNNYELVVEDITRYLCLSKS